MTQPRPHRNSGPEGPKEERFRPLVFGEALFDHFPDGSRVLGGAPFNVAWHLRGFKADPQMITSVGRDQAGAEILTRMARWRMDTSGVQLHPTRPTGRVLAHLEKGKPRYTIEAKQAYDAIATERLPPPPALASASLLYHGSLAVREETSARALAYLKTHLQVPILVDVNLRDPWWSVKPTSEKIRGVEWAKLNREEVGLLANRPVETEDALVDGARNLREKLEIGTLVVTMGADGALAFGDGGIVDAGAPTLPEVVDTVGAGDAFTAVLALGIHHAWPLDLTLQRASEFAGEICRIRGAIPSDSEPYSRHLRRWDHAS